MIGADAVIKLTDFGTSKKIKDDLENEKSLFEDAQQVVKSKSFKGSPYWMAPELVNRNGHSFPADVWSIGCVVIEMLTSKPPYAD